jgi:hypothetical protein
MKNPFPHGLTAKENKHLMAWYLANEFGRAMSSACFTEAEARFAANAINQHDRLVAALRQAIDLRVALYRHSDPEGDTDSWPDERVISRDKYAARWAALLTEEKET